jgi:uncharacterized protein
MIKPFQKTQFEFTQYLRDPDLFELPTNIQRDRMQVYVELIYNNIEGFISGAFPVLRSIIPDQQWHGMVRDFIKHHSAQTPYFLQISQEFLTYLFQNPHPLQTKFPFMAALAHYEWVELALDVSEEVLPESCDFPENFLHENALLSPLTMILVYPWPVQKISPGYIPSTETETHLMVYRNRQDEIKFVELTATSSRFLQLCRDNPQNLLQEQINQLTHETGNAAFTNQQIEAFCRQLHHLEILFFPNVIKLT